MFLSRLVFRARCGIQLYQFLIVAFLSTFQYLTSSDSGETQGSTILPLVTVGSHQDPLSLPLVTEESHQGPITLPLLPVRSHQKPLLNL